MKPVKKIKNFFRSIKYGIENLITWLPIIWSDRDWDQWYLYNILKFKLTQMEKLQRKYGISVNSIKIADQIKVCINLLDRLIKDEYGENIFKHHNEKWGDSHFNFTPCEDRKEYSKLIITRDNVNSKEDEEQERKEFIRLIKHEDKLKKQDIDYLFTLMNKHIEGWWD